LGCSKYLADSRVESFRVCCSLVHWPKNPNFYYISGFKSVELARLISLLPPDFLEACKINSIEPLDKLYFIKRKNIPFPEYIRDDD
jgi:hypothetical protein